MWVSGERFNVDYLLDVATGRVLRRVALDQRGGTTGGLGRSCGGAFVAVYVARGRDQLVLQIGGERVPLDVTVRATHRLKLGGALSRITVSRASGPDLSARQWIVPGAVLRRVDPGYDDLDALGHDFLADVTSIVNSQERQEWILRVKDPEAGPWDT